MKVRGLTIDELEDIGAVLYLVLSNVRTIGRYVHFKLSPIHSRHHYARTTTSGRGLKACSFEAFRDFTYLVFRRYKQRTDDSLRLTRDESRYPIRVASASGHWQSLEQFEDDEDRLAQVNIGSAMDPHTFESLSNAYVEFDHLGRMYPVFDEDPPPFESDYKPMALRAKLKEIEDDRRNQDELRDERLVNQVGAQHEVDQVGAA